MKRLIYLFVLVLSLTIAVYAANYQTRPYIAPVQTTQLITPCVPWRELGTITDANATLDVGDRDYTTVWALADVNTIKWDVPDDASGVEFRFQTSADGDAHVVEIWIARDATYNGSTTDDQFMLGAILTLTGGTQVGPHSNVFVDTISAAEYILSDGEVCDSEANRICVWRVDLRGYKKVLIIATTFEASKTLYADGTWY